MLILKIPLQYFTGCTVTKKKIDANVNKVGKDAKMTILGSFGKNLNVCFMLSEMSKISKILPFFVVVYVLRLPDL